MYKIVQAGLILGKIFGYFEYSWFYVFIPTYILAIVLLICLVVRKYIDKKY